MQQLLVSCNELNSIQSITLRVDGTLWTSEMLFFLPNEILVNIQYVNQLYDTLPLWYLRDGNGSGRTHNSNLSALYKCWSLQCTSTGTRRIRRQVGKVSHNGTNK